MAKDANIEEMRKLVADFLDMELEKVTANAKIMADLGADSLDAADLIGEMETAYDCEIPDKYAVKILTAQDAYEYVNDPDAYKKKCDEQGYKGAGEFA
ncbi:MAG: acyl carrier protein [Pseudomonadota bacterium]